MKQLAGPQLTVLPCVLCSATMVKTEPGSLPEGKVKIKLEHDGTILDVDEDDVEKVSVELVPNIQL